MKGQYPASMYQVTGLLPMLFRVWLIRPLSELAKDSYFDTNATRFESCRCNRLQSSKRGLQGVALIRRGLHCSSGPQTLSTFLFCYTVYRIHNRFDF